MHFASWMEVLFGHILTGHFQVYVWTGSCAFALEDSYTFEVFQIFLEHRYTFDVFQILSFSTLFKLGPDFSWNFVANHWRTVSKRPVSCKSLDCKVCFSFSICIPAAQENVQLWHCAWHWLLACFFQQPA